MAGNRHHFIPRFLMRGFSTLRKKDVYQTWVYRKDKKVFPTNTTKINIETNFYGFEDDSELDNKITDIEPYFLKYFDKIKDFTTSCNIDKSFCVDFITHLIIRTKYIRNTIEYTVNEILSYLEEESRIENSFQNFLIKYVRKNITSVKNEIRQAILIKYSNINIFEINSFIDNVISNLINYNLAGTKQYKIPNLIADMLRNSIKKNQYIFFNTMSEMKNTTNLLSKNIHNKGLNKVIEVKASEHSENELFKLNWLLHYDKTANYILGDVGPIVNCNGTFGSIINNSENYTQIFMPITSKHLIIGYVDESLNIPTSEELNIQIARASQEYFISELETDLNKSLINEIGTNLLSLDLENLND